MSSGIIKVDSTTTEEIKDDIIKFLESGGDSVDLASYFDGSENQQLVNLFLAIWIQLSEKLNTVRLDSNVLSAVTSGALKYGAMSLLGYSPKQNIAPKHDLNLKSYLGFTGTSGFSNTQYVDEQVVGKTVVNSTNYNISLFKKVYNSNSTHPLKYRCALGDWKVTTIDFETLSSQSLFSSKFIVINVDEEKNVIDDSDSTRIILNYDSGKLELKVLRNLKELANCSDEEKGRAVVAMYNYFGGLTLIFGDGNLFGEQYNSDSLDIAKTENSVEIHYFVTAGKVNSLDLGDITWDTNLIDTTFDVYFAPFVQGANYEGINSIRYNSMSEFASAQKICTPTDLTVALSQIPLIKSSYCYRDSGSSYDWISGEEYAKGTICAYNGTNYVCISAIVKNSTSSVSNPKANTTNWLEVSNCVWWDNASLRLYALVGERKEYWHSQKQYLVGEIAIYNSNYYKCIADTSDYTASTGENTNPAEGTDFWELYTPEEWISLTQAQWELEYNSGFNFKNRLGFLSIKVMPCTIVSKDYDITVIRDTSNRVSDTTLADSILEILEDDWYSLGRFYSAGRIVSEALKLDGISKFYLKGERNKRLGNGDYFKKGNVNITFKDEDSTGENYLEA